MEHSMRPVVLTTHVAVEQAGVVKAVCGLLVGGDEADQTRPTNPSEAVVSVEGCTPESCGR